MSIIPTSVQQLRDRARSPDLTAPTSLNTFLRRADVEALLDCKIMAANERIADWGNTLQQMLGAEKPDLAACLKQMQRMTDEEDRAGALRVVRKHLNTLDLFMLVAETVSGAVLVDRNDNAVEVR